MSLYQLTSRRRGWLHHLHNEQFLKNCVPARGRAPLHGSASAGVANINEKAMREVLRGNFIWQPQGYRLLIRPQT